MRRLGVITELGTMFHNMFQVDSTVPFDLVPVVVVVVVVVVAGTHFTTDFTRSEGYSKTNMQHRRSNSNTVGRTHQMMISAPLSFFLLFVAVNKNNNNNVILIEGMKLQQQQQQQRPISIKIGNHYQPHDPVFVIANKIMPFNNPTETYRYYSLPFCQTHDDDDMKEFEKQDVEESMVTTERRLQPNGGYEGAMPYGQRFGQDLVGDSRETTPFRISFLDSNEFVPLCTKIHNSTELQKFKKAISRYYFYEMFVEDIPMWGYVGEVTDDDDAFVRDDLDNVVREYLYPHFDFSIGYNEDQIVGVRVSTDLSRKVDITNTSGPIQVKYSYSIEWYKESLEWQHRHSRYEGKLHWLSIISSFVVVLLVTALLSIFMLRILKKDVARYLDLDNEALEGEETGWKLIHGDVFRFPNHSTLFCAAVGTGNHLFVLTFCHLSLAISGIISTHRRGSILAGAVVLYCLTSFIGGYTSVRLYRQMNGKDWTRCLLLTTALFPLPVFCVFMWVNTIAILRGSTSALPISAVFIVSALFLFVSVPLTVVGGHVAKQFANDDFNAPTSTTKIAREIPTVIATYRSRVFQMMISGFLPYSAIYIELHYIFASIWGYQALSIFGILFLAFILLVVVSSSITIALVYFQLAHEDHRWWWAAYVNGGISGLFIYLYSVYFYFQLSSMSGMLQGSQFFGYMAIASFAFFLMMGSSAFQLSLTFVKYIYSRIKSD